MTRKVARTAANPGDPFTHQYDRSEYVVLGTAARRDADSGRLLIKEPGKQIAKEAQKREK